MTVENIDTDDFNKECDDKEKIADFWVPCRICQEVQNAIAPLARERFAKARLGYDPAHATGTQNPHRSHQTLCRPRCKPENHGPASLAGWRHLPIMRQQEPPLSRQSAALGMSDK